VETRGLLDQPVTGAMTPEQGKTLEQQLGKQRSQEISSRVPKGGNQWSSYPQRDIQSPMGVMDEDEDEVTAAR
jgi:Mn-containing catalase